MKFLAFAAGVVVGIVVASLGWLVLIEIDELGAEEL